MKQITIKELKMYLDTGLKVKTKHDIETLSMCNSSGVYLEYKYDLYSLDDIKPLLKPLSDYKDINGEAMRELDCVRNIKVNINNIARGYYDWNECTHASVEFMAQNHIDFQDLISRGLAINLNELKQ